MIIGVAGKAQAGKDTLTHMIIDTFLNTRGIEFTHMAFAGVLKNMCKEYFNLTYGQLWGEEKEIMTGYPKPGKTEFSSNPADYWTPREIMQEVGGFFRSIDRDFWVKQLMKSASEHENVIVSDVRHLNEVACVKNAGGLVIKINRPDLAKIHNMQHESETALDDFCDFDIVIENNGTLDDLRGSAVEVVNMILSLYFINKETSY